MALFCGVMSFIAVADTFIVYTMLIASSKCDDYYVKNKKDIGYEEDKKYND